MSDAHKDFEDGMSKLDYDRFVKFDNDIWNAAIEAAAKLADGNNTGTASSSQIRRLKK